MARKESFPLGVVRDHPIHLLLKQYMCERRRASLSWGQVMDILILCPGEPAAC
jgi:hypothetical protein